LRLAGRRSRKLLISVKQTLSHADQGKALIMRTIGEITRMCCIPSIALFMLWAVPLVYGQEGLLDDKVFSGRYKENHISTVKEEKLSFMNGELHSMVYARKGFVKGVYKAVAKQDGIHFEAVSRSPKQGTIDWRGIVSGDSIVVHYQWKKEGWLTDTIRNYSFTGTIVE
jgi:hypothetical protein